MTTAAPPITAKSASTVTAMVTNGDAPGGKVPPTMRRPARAMRPCVLSPDKIKTESSLMLKSARPPNLAKVLPWLAVKVPTVMVPFVTGACKFGSPTKPTETCSAG